MGREVSESCVESLLTEIVSSDCNGFYANKPELAARRIEAIGFQVGHQLSESVLGLRSEMSEGEPEDLGQLENDLSVRQVCANGICMGTTVVEAKLDEGNIQEAESALREGLSLNFEEARALLGRLEYQRGNVEGALRVFDGIDLQAAIQRLQPLAEKQPSKRGRSQSGSTHVVSQHAANLVLETVYLKAKSLQKLGRVTGTLMRLLKNEKVYLML